MNLQEMHNYNEQKASSILAELNPVYKEKTRN